MPSPPPSTVIPNPVLVEVTRGAAVESRHRGAAAVVAANGDLVHAWGDITAPVYPRSAIKAIQALPLIETGAADRCQVTAQELALACASHSAEPTHLAVAAAWRDRLGLKTEDLACGAHPPLGETAAEAMLRAGQTPTRLHNNCSGKHFGMLSTAIQLGAPIAGYHEFDHLVQAGIRDALETMTGCAPAPAPTGIDGCGVPTYAMPLANLALGMARIADSGRLATTRQSAIRRILVAAELHPDMIAGADRLDSAVLARKGRSVFIKTGAEGVYCAALPRLELGVAIKIDDGAKRAAETAIGAILSYLGALDGDDMQALARYFAPPVINAEGAPVGAVRIAAGWLEEE